MRLSKLLLTAVAALFLNVPPGSGQEVSSLEIHDRVRVTIEDDGQYVGTLTELSAHSIVVNTADTGSQALDIASIKQLEVSLGTSRQGKLWRGVGIGALAGAAAGALYWGMTSVQSDAGGGTNGGVAIGIGAGIGAVAGAIIGSGPKQEDWQEIPIESLELGIGPIQGGGWKLVGSVSF